MIHAGLPPQWDLAPAQSCARELEAGIARRRRAASSCSRTCTATSRIAGRTICAASSACASSPTASRGCASVAPTARLELKYKGKSSRAAGVMPWFRVPQRRSRDLRIVCGHWSALGYYEGDGVLSIDTGCVWGSKLCAVRLDRSAAPVFVPCSSSGLSPDSE